MGLDIQSAGRFRLLKNVLEGKIAEGDAVSLKTVLFDAAGRKVKFYKKQEAMLTDDADFSINLPKESVGTTYSTDEPTNLDKGMVWIQ